MDTPQFFHRYSQPIIEHGTWFIVLGVLAWTILLVYFFKFNWGKSIIRKMAVSRERSVRARVTAARTSHVMLDELTAEAVRYATEAEAAAKTADIASAAGAAKDAAMLAARAAEYASAASTAAMQTAKAIRVGAKGLSRAHDKTFGRAQVDTAAAAATAAQAAAERAERAAVAKGG